MSTLDALRLRHQARLYSKQIVQSGGEALVNARTGYIERLDTSLGGTAYPVFVLGLHDPDDTVTARVVA